MCNADMLQTSFFGLAMDLPPEDKFMFDGHPGEPNYSGAVKLCVIIGGSFGLWGLIAAATLPFVLR